MASSDPLVALRESIVASKPPILTKTSDPTSAADVVPIAQATHLQFNHNDRHQSFPLSLSTRFAPNDNSVDLRSVYFAWLNKDVGVPDYIAAAQQINQELSAPGGAGGSITNLVFLQRHDLATWLEGTSDASEFIKPLAAEDAKAQAEAAANIVAASAGGAASVQSASAGTKSAKAVDQRLLDIYSLERKLGDRNSVLRGIKPTVSLQHWSLPPFEGPWH
jgi:parafibromin